MLRDDLPGRDEILSKHLAANPDEASPIRDTAPACFHQPRPPTRRAFAPVGHVALDLRPEQNAELGLLRPPLSSSTTPDGGDGDGDGDRVNDKERIVWVAGLYISHALQAGGIGGETMRLAEAIAAREPLWAGWIVLDTSTSSLLVFIFLGREEVGGGGENGAKGRKTFLISQLLLQPSPPPHPPPPLLSLCPLRHHRGRPFLGTGLDRPN